MASCKIAERKILDKLPFEIIDFSEDDKSKTNTFRDSVFVGPKKYVLPSTYKKLALDIYNFEARPDDIYLTGVQRTGTTLTGELVWLIENDLDFDGAAKDVLDYRYPHIDYDVLGTIKAINYFKKIKECDAETAEIIQKYEQLHLEDLSKAKGRRFLRSHLPLSLMSPQIFEVGAKVIYCARNPKDVTVSLYNLMSHVNGMPAKSFKDSIDDFKNGTAYAYPFFENVKEGLDRKDDKNFLFLFYEDTMKDKRAAIEKVADFLGKKLSKDQIDRLEEHLNIENFRDNKSLNWHHLVQLGLFKDSNKFIRKGKSGGWKDWFDEELEKEFNQIVEEKLKGTGLRFPVWSI